MSSCSISLCPWKYNLASSSLHLFETFSRLSCPNSEPRFLSFSLPTHYPETAFRKEQEGEEMSRTAAWTEKDKDRCSEWTGRREDSARLWTWPLLVVLMNGEERAGMGDKPDQSVFVAASQMRRNSDTFTSRRKSLRTVGSIQTPPPHHHHQTFWLIINSPGLRMCAIMFVFVQGYTCICFLRRSMWPHAQMNLLKGNKQAVCLDLWCAGIQGITQSL